MSLGFGELLLILVIVMMVFGAGRLPRVMGDVAKGLKEFRKGLATDTEKSAE